MLRTRRPPFDKSHQLTPDAEEKSEGAKQVPGYPRVSLNDRSRVLDFLTEEFCNDDLDKMAGKLWLMSRQSSENISPLHRQAVKRRMIVVTEEPKLHLVWYHDRIFVKPLPRYLGDYGFWHDHICAKDGTDERALRVQRAALGFIRTYYHLIRSETDFRIAKDPSLALIPEHVTWEDFCAFTGSLNTIEDREVSERYQYGEIRLTRLNMYAPFLLGKSHFQRVEYQYGPYFARLFVPILFVMGVLSVILSGMQVIFTASEGGAAVRSRRWADAAFGFSVASIVVACGLLIVLGVAVVYKICMEWQVAIRDRRRLTKQRNKEKQGQAPGRGNA
ncbi:hypothetical protein VD0004_g3151 [Verticillium dahliae]|uniref:Subtilisin-like serine protease n=1 Tax=Verticillium dahliae TaxID=27337 RepID=A0A444S384_VERDA|nr:hypothetical protein VD0004_g3151 [Verticillium dahliae]PNH75415.1 hypothetical protein VD0001_g2114 [Verticillium dahliae]RXG47779.1 hypothetical protein VDGE_04173 [Verticillium dahliae]